MTVSLADQPGVEVLAVQVRVAPTFVLKYNIRTRSLADQGAIKNVLTVENDVVPFDRADVLEQVASLPSLVTASARPVRVICLACQLTSRRKDHGRVLEVHESREGRFERLLAQVPVRGPCELAVGQIGDAGPRREAEVAGLQAWATRSGFLTSSYPASPEELLNPLISESSAFFLDFRPALTRIGRSFGKSGLAFQGAMNVPDRRETRPIRSGDVLEQVASLLPW